MPFDISWEQRGCYQRYWGFVPESEFIQSVAAFHNDPRFDDFLYVINDFLEVEDFDVSPQTVEQVAILNLGAQSCHAEGRFAIVSTDERIITLAQCFSFPHLRSYPTEVFATVKDARAWIKETTPSVWLETSWKLHNIKV